MKKYLLLFLFVPFLLGNSLRSDQASITTPQNFLVRVNCTLSTTATTSAIITGCTAPGAGVSIFITNISVSSSIISTVTNFPTIQYGTGGTCGTGTTVIWRIFLPTAFATVQQSLVTPIKIPANNELCILHPGAGTKLINIQGYLG